MTDTDDDAGLPHKGAVDDSNTIEGQLTSAKGPLHPSRHLFYQLQKYVADAHYPATKAALYNHARERGAGPDTLNALGSLQRSSYGTLGEVRNELTANDG